MRDIKFRGLDINGSWHYGLLSNTKNRGVCGELGWFISNKSGSAYAYQVRPETLGQYTGLQAALGVDIYEGDIIYIAGYGDYKVEFPFEELYEAAREDDLGTIKGNIHQNPELL